MNQTAYTQGQIRTFDRDEVIRTRTVEFVISDGSKDRYGTVCNTRGWKLDNFNANGIVGYQHNVYGDMCGAPNPDDVIGVGRAWVEGDLLIGSVTFEPAELNPLAEKIFQKVLHGSLKATSVGFMELGEGRYGDGEQACGRADQTYYFEAQELLEFSIVNIPANANALKRSVREQSAHALMYLRRATGLSFADVEKMTVRDVLDSLEGKRSASGVVALGVVAPAAPAAPAASTAVDIVDPVTELTPVTLTEPVQTPDFRSALREALYGTPSEQLRKALRAALA